MEKNREGNKKKYLIIGIILLCIVILLSTYALYTFVVFDNLTVDSNTNNLDYYINYAKGTDITSGTLNPTTNYLDGNSVSIELWKKNDDYTIYGHIYMDINSIGDNLKKSSGLKYTVVNNSTIIASGSIGGYESGTSVLLKENINLETSQQFYTVYLWLDENAINNYDIEYENISATIRCEATMKEINPASKYIRNLYTPNTTAVNNSIRYNLDSTNNLMEDVAGNIRYYGASPSNYIDIGDVYKGDITIKRWEELGVAGTTEEECKEFFDCSINYSNLGFSSEDECNSNLPTMVQQEFGMTIEEFNNTYCVIETIPKKGTPILYRIIGIFGDKIKVIRNENIGFYSWDTSASDVNSGRGINEWSQADLMKLINQGYESESIGGSLWYNSASGPCYNGKNNATTECDFTSTGLSDNVKNKIEEVTWNLGGWNTANGVYSNQLYEYERGTNVKSSPSDGITRTTSWTGKVALAYPSDYGYAADLTQCNQTLDSYSDTTCTNNNWLYNSAKQWLLTPYSSYADFAWNVSSDGSLYHGSTFNAFRVRPVLYLSSDTGIVSGDGSESNPYRIS